MTYDDMLSILSDEVDKLKKRVAHLEERTNGRVTQIKDSRENYALRKELQNEFDS